MTLLLKEISECSLSSTRNLRNLDLRGFNEWRSTSEISRNRQSRRRYSPSEESGTSKYTESLVEEGWLNYQ